MEHIFVAKSERTRVKEMETQASVHRSKNKDRREKRRERQVQRLLELTGAVESESTAADENAGIPPQQNQ